MNHNRKYKVILFDFDGTLVNTTPLILRSFAATWQQMFGFALAEADYIQTFGIPINKAMEQLLTRMIDDRMVARPASITASAEEMVMVYRTFNNEWHDQMILPFDGIDETLAELKQRGCQLGLVSSKKGVGVERGMKLFGLAEFFEVIVCAEDTTNHKPHPAPLLHAMTQLSASPADTIYVGDSSHDIIAGQAAGIATAAATWGPFDRAVLASLQPDHLLERPAELLTLC